LIEAWTIFIDRVEVLPGRIEPLKNTLDEYVDRAKDFPAQANELV
jgi:hypothetical protein